MQQCCNIKFVKLNTPVDILQKKKLRNTAFRQQVLDVFLANEGAISQEKIAESLGEHDRITLYRTIKVFIEKGILHEVALPGEDERYALCAPECTHKHEEHLHQHIHFQCSNCNTVSCIDLPENIQLSLPNYQVKQWSINAQGLCTTCAT